MIGAHDLAYATKDVEVFEIYQCWKDGADYTAGLYGLRCHIFQAKCTATSKITLEYR